MEDEAQHALRALLRDQYGVVTAAQLRTAGFTTSRAARLVEAGALITMRRGLFRSAAHEVSHHQRLLAAVLDRGGGAAASHLSAAWLLGTDGVRAGRPHVAAGGKARSGRTTLGAVHRLDLDVAALSSPVDRIPCLLPEPALLTVAALGWPRRFADVLDDFFVRRLTDFARVDDFLAAHARQGRNGTVLLREAAAEWAEGVLPDSHPEAKLIRRLRLLGFTCVPQYRLDFPSGGHARFDVAIPALHVGVEYQSDAHHRAERHHGPDARRAQRIAGLGWAVVPATKHDLRDGCVALAAAIRREAAALAP